MRINVPFGRFGFTSSKLIIAGVTAALLSGCSGSIDRFSANYDNPSDVDPVYTASVPKYVKPAKLKYAQPKALAYRDDAIVQSPIVSAPLNKPIAQNYDYVQSYKKPYKQPTLKQPEIAYDEQPVAPVLKKPIYKTQSYKAPTYNQPDYDAENVVADTETAPTQAPIYKKPIAKSGATVRVAEGMTLYSIAKANGLSVQQLADANNIAQPYTVSTGRVLRIPGATTAQVPETNFVAKKKPMSLAEEEQVAPIAAPKMKSGGTYHVASGDTLYSLGRKFNVSPFAIAKLNGFAQDRPLSLGQTIRVPAGGTVAAAQLKPKKLVLDDENDSSQASADENAAEPVAVPKAQASVKDVPAIPSEAATNLAMRWPVRGKVISDFGKKPSGLKNEGINISVPEGTSIRAAESGVVAYAGNELKGYGNLILIRHAGGFVTAYAHAKSLNVKRGDTVKRGDVIAVAGQTGAVQSPQLHFEVRKGATALDPTKYLSSSTAMN